MALGAFGVLSSDPPTVHIVDDSGKRQLVRWQLQQPGIYLSDQSYKYQPDQLINWESDSIQPKIGDDSERDWANNMENNNILLHAGRADSLINGQPNPWYVPGAVYHSSQTRTHLMGDMEFNENLKVYTFDNYIYDFGEDGLPGDHYIDKGGDGMFQKGECFNPDPNFNSFNINFLYNCSF